MSTDVLDARLTAFEREQLAALDTPRKIQDFLDGVVYEPEYFNRSPLRVLRECRGHCLDGALFAAYTLSRLGDPPLVVDLMQEPGLDDDHVLAIFRRNGRLGALAKSNFTGLRYREPVYASVRELVMSYFEDYFNVNGVRTLPRLHRSDRPAPLRPAELAVGRRRLRCHRAQFQDRAPLRADHAADGRRTRPLGRTGIRRGYARLGCRGTLQAADCVMLDAAACPCARVERRAGCSFSASRGTLQAQRDHLRNSPTIPGSSTNSASAGCPRRTWLTRSQLKR